MRQFNGPTARPDPADRNGLTIGNGISASGVAPHGVTNRYTYTVPASRKAIVCAWSGIGIRQTAAAPVGLVEIDCRFITASALNARVGQDMSLDNTVGAKCVLNLAPQQVLLSTEAVNFLTADASTGGTWLYQSFFTGTEYDA